MQKGENSSDALTKNIRTIFHKINSKEYELKHQLDFLRVENYSLKEKLKSKEESELRVNKNLKKSHSEITTIEHQESQQQYEQQQQTEKVMNESTESNTEASKQISIGLSKTVKQHNSTNKYKNEQSSQMHKLSNKNEDTSIEQDEEDDEIYVILDDN